MKSTFFATAFALAITAVSAQSYEDLNIPTCANACGQFLTDQYTTCDMPAAASDVDTAEEGAGLIRCLCADDAFLMTIWSCVTGNCLEADQLVMRGQADTYCGLVGVPIPSSVYGGPIVTSSAPSNGTSATTTTQTGVTIQTVTPSSNGTFTNTTRTTTSGTASITSSTTGTSTTGTATTDTATTDTAAGAETSTVSTGGAAAGVAAGSGFFAAAMGAMLFML